MDEIVYTRETLRRALQSGIDQLDKAADSYDPADDVPSEDALAAVTISLALQSTATAYVDAVKDRVEVRNGLA